MSHYLIDEKATSKLVQKLLPLLKPGLLIFLKGDLGAGKTSFVKICAEFLGVPRTEVHSPTFSLVNEYRGRDMELVHCDFYRLPEGEMLDDLGGTEFFYQEKLFFLEWGERLGIAPFLPINRRIDIQLWAEPPQEGRWCSLPPKWEVFLKGGG